MSQDIKPTKLHNDINKTKSNAPTHQSTYQLTTPISPIAQAQPTQPHRLVKSVFTSLFTLYAENQNLCSAENMLQRRDSRPQPLILRPWKSHLPDDIVLNILSRLPVKSLLRFRCVCKTWDSSITTPNFISTHLNNNKDHDHGHDHACLIQTGIQYNSSKIPKVC